MKSRYTARNGDSLRALQRVFDKGVSIDFYIIRDIGQKRTAFPVPPEIRQAVEIRTSRLFLSSAVNCERRSLHLLLIAAFFFAYISQEHWSDSSIFFIFASPTKAAPIAIPNFTALPMPLAVIILPSVTTNESESSAPSSSLSKPGKQTAFCL